MDRSHAMSPIGTPHTLFYTYIYTYTYTYTYPILFYTSTYSTLYTYSILTFYLFSTYFIPTLFYTYFILYLLYSLYTPYLYTFILPFTLHLLLPTIQLSSSISSSQSLYFISHPSNSRRIIYHSSTFSFLWLAANSLPMRSFSFHFF